jgi:hypothetical protein
MVRARLLKTSGATDRPDSGQEDRMIHRQDFTRTAGVLKGLAALAALATGLGACSHGATPAEPSTVTVTVQAAPSGEAAAPAMPTHHRRTASLAEFDGDYFTIRHPAAWLVEAAEVSKGSYMDTTIASSARAGELIRVDVEPAARGTAYSHALKVRSYLVDQPGYEEIAFTSGRYLGRDSVRWEFLVEEDGVLLHKADTFFNAQGDGFAVLTQAPANRYGRWARTFRRIEASLQVPTLNGSSLTSPPAVVGDFCLSRACIDNFYNGVGYIVQCADGMWSHSGGRPGACSWHGGETNNVYSGSVSAPSDDYGNDGTDLGPGNGYTVICADGSISHSGGISGACSWHGGVAGN